MNAVDLLDSRKTFNSIGVFARAWVDALDRGEVDGDPKAFQTLINVLNPSISHKLNEEEATEMIRARPDLIEKPKPPAPAMHAEALDTVPIVEVSKVKRVRRTKAEIAAGVVKGGLTTQTGKKKGLTKDQWADATRLAPGEAEALRREDVKNAPADPELARALAIKEVILPAWKAEGGRGALTRIRVNLERHGVPIPTSEWEPALKAAGIKFAGMQTIVNVEGRQLEFLIQ